MIEAFRKSNEKLAALMFHNPEAIKEHHGNIKNLCDAAEKAHVKQVNFEEKKIEENERREAVSKKSERDIKKLKVTGRKKQSDLDDLLGSFNHSTMLPPPKKTNASVSDTKHVSSPNDTPAKAKQKSDLLEK